MNDGSSVDSIWTKGAPVSHQVQTIGNTFDPDMLTINVLDTVFFTGLGYHNATEVDEATYLANGTTSNGGFEYLFDDFHVFTEPGTYYYVCTPHAGMGMKGMITVNNDWTLYQTSSVTGGEPTYDFWTDNANVAGLPLVTLYTDGNGAIYNADFLTTTPMVSDLQEEELLNTSVYPNPAQDYIIISVKEASTLQILSVDGKIVYESAFTEQERVSLKDFAEGMYLYKVQTKDATQSGTFNIVR
jgi:plastocyanin